MRQLFALLVGIAVMGGCTTPRQSASSVEVSDSAGVRIVLSYEPQWEEGEAWSVSSEPQLTIGVLNGPEEYQLFDLSAAARQSDGDFVVVDGGLREVRLYAGDGAFVRTLGGPGSGPGEFQNPAQVLVTAGDSIVVWDNATYRITRFDPAGEFVSVRSVDRGWIARAIEPPLYPSTAKLLPDGQLLVRLIEKGKSSPQGTFRSRSGALRLSADYSRIDTLMFFGGIEQVSVHAPWGETAVVPAGAKRTLTAVQSTLSRVCIGDQEGPEIACFGPDGSRTLVRWDSETATATAEDIAAWRDTTIAGYAQKISEAEAIRMVDQVPIPTVRPHYTRLTLDRVGNLWVDQGPASRAALESVDHLVFDRGGTLLGVVALPPIQVLEIGDDYVLGIFRDELEVEYLHVYELVK